MPCYVITYDLRKVRNYQPLYDQLGKWGAVPLLESVWLAELKGPASAIRDILGNLMDSDDGLAVLELAPDFQWATRKISVVANNWLQAKSP